MLKFSIFTQYINSPLSLEKRQPYRRVSCILKEAKRIKSLIEAGHKHVGNGLSSF
jgi:hypothetical protein